MTDWPLDSLPCTTRTVKGIAEGKFLLAEHWRPAQVPYRSLLPMGVENLLVPVCLSSTHVGWGTLRLEPVWVQTGEAAGLASALAVRQGVSPAGLDPDRLVRALVERRAMVSFFNDIDVAGSEPWIPAVEYFATKGFFGSYNARPGDPLTPKLAVHWLEITQALIDSAPLEPLAAARRSRVLEGEVSGGGPLPSIPGAPSGPLTRGEACLYLYELLSTP